MTEKSILVIDTDAETSRNIKDILESEGYAVYSTSGRSESISTALKIKPSLVFINIAMRDTSGLEIAKGIHESEQLKDVPIIIITPHGGTVEPRYTLMYGIIDFIKKSFTSEELISKTIDVTEMNVPGAARAEERPLETREQKTSGLIDEEPVAKELGEDELHFGETVASPPDENETFKEVLAEISTDVASQPGNSDDRTATESVDQPDEIAKPEPVIETDLPTDEHPEPSSEEPDMATTADNAPPSYEARKPRLAVFIFIAVLATIGAGIGVYLFTGFSGKPKVTPPVVSLPSSAPRQAVQKSVQNSPQAPEPSKEMKIPRQGSDTAEKDLSAQAMKNPGKRSEENKPKAVKPTPAKESKPFFSVQVGVFKNRANASALVRHFAGLGYKSFSHETPGKNKGQLYRVLIGRFENRGGAETLAREIRSKENTGALIFSAPGKKK